jgi:hypothetical protein
MRKPNRTVSIFTLSALDVLAMATGVFVLLVVMLMPYYRKTHDANAAIEAVRVETVETTAEIEPLKETAVTTAAEAAAVEAEVAAIEAAAQALENQPAPAPVVREAGGEQQVVVEALDLVFVIDTTASMTPVIRQLAASMRSIVRILERMVPSVRIGVAAYKDRDTGLAPVVVLPLTPTDPGLDRIIRFVEALDAAPVGSRTIEEDVHLGLDAAMAMKFRRDARQALVLIGDAGVHQRFRNEAVFRVRSFVQGQELRTVSALHVTTPSSLSHGQRGRPFFQEVALAGNGDFNDHAGSMIASILLSLLTDT